MDMVTLQNVSKIYGKGDSAVTALDNVTLSIEKGEMVAVIGPSGSGKSTFLHVIGGVDSPTTGRVLVDGEDITNFNDEQLSVFRRRRIGFIFQSYHLIPVLTVQENIEMSVLLDHKKVDKDYSNYLMELLGIKDKRRKMPAELSGGQQQRVAIARALANHPALLLADEPTGSLDSQNGQEVLNLLKETSMKLQQTLVVVTHNIDLAREMDRIILVSDGRMETDKMK